MINNEHNERDLADLWGDVEDDHACWLANKRDDVAITLTGMLHAKGVSFAQLADRLDWKRSRVSRALSGKENLTINTIAEIVQAAGFDFDIAVRNQGETRHFQPWERQEVDFEKRIFGQFSWAEPEQSATRTIEDAIQRASCRISSPPQAGYNFFEVGAANDDMISPCLSIAVGG